MPVTNRGVVQLAPNSTTPTGGALSDYINALIPSLATLKTGLAIFALIVIARSCTRRTCTWLRRIRGADGRIGNPGVLDHQRRRQQLQQLQTQQHHQAFWVMEEKRNQEKAMQWPEEKYEGGFVDAAPPGQRLTIDSNWTGNSPGAGAGEALSRQLMSRPPPAPPLTPPELSTAVFTFEGRPRGPFDDSFIHQPNPDYMSSTVPAESDSTTTGMSPLGSASPTMPRRRSYHKTLPIGVPVSQSSLAESEPADLTFSPSSYPPSSPLLPPAPPMGAQPLEIGVQGEIVGVLDGEGAGWTRHMRVYGGGVCLACAASGGNHGGGFYGATVRPEEMR